MSISRCVIFDSGRRGGAAEQPMEPLIRHRQARQIVEIPLIENDAAVVVQVERVSPRSAAAYFGSPYGARPINLYSPLLILKPQ